MHIIALFFFLTRGYRTESLLHLVIVCECEQTETRTLKSQLRICYRLKILKTSFEFGIVIQSEQSLWC